MCTFWLLLNWFHFSSACFKAKSRIRQHMSNQFELSDLKLCTHFFLYIETIISREMALQYPKFEFWPFIVIKCSRSKTVDARRNKKTTTSGCLQNIYLHCVCYFKCNSSEIQDVVVAFIIFVDSSSILT